jgi:hypothetical protein
MSSYLSSLVDSLDFSAIGAGILGVAVALVSVVCLMVGVALIIRAIRGGKGGVVKKKGGFAFTLTDRILNLDDGSIVIFGDDGSAKHYRSSGGGNQQKVGKSRGSSWGRSSGRSRGGRGGRGMKF